MTWDSTTVNDRHCVLFFTVLEKLFYSSDWRILEFVNLLTTCWRLGTKIVSMILLIREIPTRLCPYQIIFHQVKTSFYNTITKMETISSSQLTIVQWNFWLIILIYELKVTRRLFGILILTKNKIIYLEDLRDCLPIRFHPSMKRVWCPITCPLCNADLENAWHAFLGCSNITDVWNCSGC